MLTKHVSGPAAGVLKYDIITALGTAGLHRGKSDQTTALRLITLLTARYNWRRDEVSIGQKELSRLWAVDPRTVIRQMKRLRDLNLLQIKSAATRGKVASYRLDMDGLKGFTQQYWAEVGTDFDGRMIEHAPVPKAKVVHVAFGTGTAPDTTAPWGRIQDRLQRNDPALYQNWFANLRLKEGPQGTAIVTAPSRFVARYVSTHLTAALLAAVQTEMPEVEKIQIETGSG